MKHIILEFARDIEDRHLEIIKNKVLVGSIFVSVKSLCMRIITECI